MGPKLTHAEGFILGVGAKMFTIAGPVCALLAAQLRCTPTAATCSADIR